MDTANQRIEIQHNQPIKSAQELGKVTIQGAEDRQLHLADVATITEDHQLLIGDAVVGDDPGLLLVVERFPGTKVTEVTDRVEAVLADLRPGLGGIQVDTTLYRPASFIDQMVDNLVWRFVVAAVLVLLVVAGLFFSWRMAVVSLVTIGVSVSTTVLVLSWFGSAQHDVDRGTGDGARCRRGRCHRRCRDDPAATALVGDLPRRGDPALRPALGGRNGHQRGCMRRLPSPPSSLGSPWYRSWSWTAFRAPS